MLCLQVVTLQTGLFTLRAALTAVRFSADSATPALNMMRTDNERLEFQVAESSSTADKVGVQVVVAQMFILQAALDLIRNKRDWRLGF